MFLQAAKSTVSRILFPVTGVAIIYLASPLPERSSDLPGAQTKRAASRACVVLLPMGFARPPLSPAAPVRSYRTVSPSLPAEARGNLLLCCTVPSDHSAWPLASIVPYGVRTFLVPAVPARDRLVHLADAIIP